MRQSQIAKQTRYAFFFFLQRRYSSYRLNRNKETHQLWVDIMTHDESESQVITRYAKSINSFLQVNKFEKDITFYFCSTIFHIIPNIFTFVVFSYFHVLYVMSFQSLHHKIRTHICKQCKHITVLVLTFFFYRRRKY